MSRELRELLTHEGALEKRLGELWSQHYELAQRLRGELLADPGARAAARRARLTIECLKLLSANRSLAKDLERIDAVAREAKAAAAGEVVA